MSNPFAVAAKPNILHSLEQECASRYASQANLLEEIIAENRMLRLQRDAARNALSQLLMRAQIGQISAADLEQAREALL